MKKIIFYELLRKAKSRPHVMKKLKIFAIVGSIGFFLMSGLLIWAGWTATQFIAEKTQATLQSPETTRVAQTWMGEIGLLDFQPVGCWLKVQSLMTVEPWLRDSLPSHLQSLKSACLSTTSQSCQGSECV